MSDYQFHEMLDLYSKIGYEGIASYDIASIRKFYDMLFDKGY